MPLWRGTEANVVVGAIIRNRCSPLLWDYLNEGFGSSPEIALSANMEKKMMKQLVGGRAVRTGSPLEDLSDRELEVFHLLGKGYSTRQVAQELHLSVKTIESHRAHIKDKLNLRNATELVQHAIQWQEE